MRLGSHQSEEAKARMSSSLKGRVITQEWRNNLSAAGKGRVVSAETRAKLSAASMGHSVSPETLAKLSASHKGKTPSNKGVPMPDAQRLKISVSSMGKVASPEARAKLSAAGKGRPKSPEWRAKIGAANWKGGEKVASDKKHAKRRALGFIPLNSPHPGYEGHHVDKDHIIYLPKELHRSVWHNQWTGQNMDKINALAYEWLAKEEHAL